MNCGEFQNQLHEYVDGILSTDARAAAEKHLANCGACRQVMRREQQFAENLRGSLRRETAVLTLRPEIRQQILAAARRQPAPASLAKTIVAVWRQFAWPAAMAALVLITGGLWLNQHRNLPAKTPELTQASDRRPQATGQSPMVAIHFAYRVPTLKFRREGNLVVDTVTYSTVATSEMLCLGGRNP